MKNTNLQVGLLTLMLLLLQVAISFGVIIQLSDTNTSYPTD